MKPSRCRRVAVVTEAGGRSGLPWPLVVAAFLMAWCAKVTGEDVGQRIEKAESDYLADRQESMK